MATQGAETALPRAQARIAESTPSESGFSAEELEVISAYGSACELGETTSCNTLGVLYSKHRGDGERTYLPEAARLFKRACEAGDSTGCNNLGILYLDPVGVFDDAGLLGNKPSRASGQAKMAAALFDRACRAGSSDGCNNLGALRERGIDSARDIGEARSLYEKACDAGMALGCANLATLYAKHESLGTPPTATEELFVRACEAGSARGCVNLAEYAYRMHTN